MASAKATAADASQPEPLTAEEMRDFVVNGFLVIPPAASCPKEFHQEMYAKTKATCERHGFCAPKEPFSQRDLWSDPNTARLFELPEVHRALEGVLGPNYMAFPHRHVHTTSSTPGERAMVWHQDPSIFPQRTHRCRQVLLMYYPGEVTAAEGPTSLVPGSQYFSRDTGKFGSTETQNYAGHHLKADAIRKTILDGRLGKTAGEQQIREMVRDFKTNAEKASFPTPFDGFVPAGSFIINHYDIVHRGTPKFDDSAFRPMYKWLVVRSAHPAAALVSNAPRSLPEDPFPETSAGEGQLAIWRCMWDWIRGQPGATGAKCDLGAAARSLEAAGEMEEMERLGGAYRLARAAARGDAAALNKLIESLSSGAASSRRAAMYGLAEAGTTANVQKLLELIEAPMPADSEGRHVRCAATYALGEAVCPETSAALLRRAADALFAQLRTQAAEVQVAMAATARQSVSSEVVTKLWDALIQLGRPWATADVKQKFFDNDPTSFVNSLSAKDPEAYAALTAILNPDAAAAARAGAPASWGKDPKGGKEVAGPEPLLLWNTCLALVNLAQAMAAMGQKSEAFSLLPRFQEAIAQVSADPPPFRLGGLATDADLLALAVVAICTVPGNCTTARLNFRTPPGMSNYWNTSTFLALALTRLRASGRNAEGATAALQQMVADQTSRLQQNIRNNGAAPSAKGVQDDAKEGLSKGAKEGWNPKEGWAKEGLNKDAKEGSKDGPKGAPYPAAAKEGSKDGAKGAPYPAAAKEGSKDGAKGGADPATAKEGSKDGANGGADPAAAKEDAAEAERFAQETLHKLAAGDVTTFYDVGLARTSGAA